MLLFYFGSVVLFDGDDGGWSRSSELSWLGTRARLCVYLLDPDDDEDDVTESFPSMMSSKVGMVSTHVQLYGMVLTYILYTLRYSTTLFLSMYDNNNL